MKIEKFGTIVITKHGIIADGFEINAEGECFDHSNAAEKLAELVQKRLSEFGSNDVSFMNCTFEGRVTIQ